MPTFTVRTRMNVKAKSAKSIDTHAIAQMLGDVPGLYEVEVYTPVLHKDAQSSGRPPTDRIKAEKWLKSWLRRRAQPMPTAQVYEAAAAAGHSRRTTRRAADVIGVVRSAHGGSNVTWSLPEAHSGAVSAVEVVEGD